MAIKFVDLPVEIHQAIANSCGELGRDVLCRFALLGRHFRAMTQPILTRSADLTLIKDEHKLGLFTHHFASVYRTQLTNLSLVLGRSQIPNPYSLEDGLDDIYANIFSLLPRVHTLALVIDSGSSKDILEKEDFPQTLRAVARLEHLECLTILRDPNRAIEGSHHPESFEFISTILFTCVPKTKCLKRLNLEHIPIVLPRDFVDHSNRPSNLLHLHLQSIHIHSNPDQAHVDPFLDLIKFFSRKLESLTIRDVKIDFPLEPRPIDMPHLYCLGLQISPISDSTLLDKQMKQNENHDHKKLYRDILECFSGSSARSVKLGHSIGFSELRALQDRNGFLDVLEVTPL